MLLYEFIQLVFLLIPQALLTPWLGLDKFELGSSSSFMILSDLSAHAETKRHHVVFLAVPGQTALNVVQKCGLQSSVL